MHFVNIFVTFIMVSHQLVLCDHDALVDVGSNPYARPLTETMSKVSLIPNENHVMAYSGKVMKFVYYSTMPEQEVKFQIWRKSSGTRFTLIHQSASVITDGTGYTEYRYAEDEDFTVIAGDTIGVAILDTNPFSYSSVVCSSSVITPMTAAASVDIGDSVDFSSTGTECKEFSLAAKVLYDNAPVASLACTQLIADDGFRELMSPGYDGTSFYAVDTNVCWKISLNSNYTDADRWGVQVQILNFNFEPELVSGTCGGDVVEFKNGDTVFDYMLDEICGTTFPEYINGTASNMYIRMYTDSNTLTVSTGFRLQYRVYEVVAPTTPNWVLALGIIGCLVLVVPVVIVIFIWCRLKRKRDKEDKQKLKEAEMGFGDDRSVDDLEAISRKRHRIRSAKISPQMMRREKSLYNDPKGKEIRVDAHRDVNLREHIPKDEHIPGASEYRAPRKTGKMKHWSQLSSGITG